MADDDEGLDFGLDDDIEDILTELDAYDDKIEESAARHSEERGEGQPASGRPPAQLPGGSRKNSALQAAMKQVRDGASRLDLSHWSIRLGNDGVGALAESLQRVAKGRLSEIRLNGNDIGPKGGAPVAAALKDNSSLTRLHLTANQLGDSGTTAIAEALRTNACLKHLDLEGNNIGPSGATAIAEALMVNQGLESLHLSDNAILDAGAAALGNALVANSKLETLWLDGNKVGVSGGASLSKALQHNKTLKTLHLGTPRVGATVLAYVDK